ncbi:hypothetical protein [Gottfriedia sp. OAE603]|uniref:hypothetical protein n=1 Tax=Gottfriedia sp. OAE603 TaxID=2663872 RepID=UPI00348781FB
MKKLFISFIVFFLTFNMVKDVFAEASNDLVAPEKWVVTLEATELTVQNVETGEISTVQIPTNQLLKVEKEDTEVFFVQYNETLGFCSKK